MNTETIYQLAHDLKDTSKLRSKDVVLDDTVSFDEFFLNAETLRGLKRCGFERPSPIQLATIPLGLCGFDLVIQSKAGTGKTCIFAIIALESLKFNSTNFAQTLILAPTREIAIQVHQVVTLIGSIYENLCSALCIGGVDVKQDRIHLMNKQCQIVVGTPGRVRQLIELGILKVQQIELLVLDEADKLMDDQFKSQIDEIYKRLPHDKQMVVTSATYPNELSQFLQNYMRSPKTVRFGKELHLDAIEELYVVSQAGHSSKKNTDNKVQVLLTLLSKVVFSKCIIFTNFQARAPIICDNLNKSEQFVQEHGHSSFICAELPQTDRCRVFAAFKNSDDQRVMVSTDVSARGIDIQDIDLVINFDLPCDNSTYYHRIGRAGRFGQPGKAISIVSSDTLDKNSFEKHINSDKISKLTL